MCSLKTGESEKSRDAWSADITDAEGEAWQQNDKIAREITVRRVP